MNYRLLLITLLTISTLNASDSDASSDSEQTPLPTKIALTRARLGMLNDAAIRLTHLEEATLQKQIELGEQKDAALWQQLEQASEQYKAQFEAKQKEIEKATTRLNGLLAQDARQRNNQQTKSNV